MSTFQCTVVWVIIIIDNKILSLAYLLLFIVRLRVTKFEKLPPPPQCPSRCGRWNQTRSVVCREVATGHEVDPAHCDNAIVRPPTTQQCVVPCSECQWVPSKWRKVTFLAYNASRDAVAGSHTPQLA